jgi:hypothetical protein
MVASTPFLPLSALLDRGVCCVICYFLNGWHHARFLHLHLRFHTSAISENSFLFFDLIRTVKSLVSATVVIEVLMCEMLVVMLLLINQAIKLAIKRDSEKQYK